MWRVVLTLSILGSAHCSCPSGFDLVAAGQCRGFIGKYSLPVDQAVSVAVKKCAGFQDAQPVIVHNEEQQSYWKSKAPSVNDGSLVLGLVCDAKSKKWQWADGSALDYKPPTNLRNPALDKDCSSQDTWVIRPDGSWIYAAAGSLQAYLFCIADLQQPTFTDGCENFGQNAGTNMCFQIAAKAAKWQDAQRICQEAGANLASIHNDKENALVRQMALANGAVNGVFLGASAQDDQPFRWVDGSSMNYDPFAPGYPKPNAGYCVAMQTTSSVDGQWMNVNCNAAMPFACARKKRYAVEQPACYNENWKENEIITSPGFPSSAATPCDFLLTVAAGKKVSVEIELEANSCCDSLLIYDGSTVIATLTGEVHNATYATKSSNFMRVSWKPNGGVNVKGLAMTFRAV